MKGVEERYWDLRSQVLVALIKQPGMGRDRFGSSEAYAKYLHDLVYMIVPVTEDEKGEVEYERMVRAEKYEQMVRAEKLVEELRKEARGRAERQARNWDATPCCASEGTNAEGG